MPSYHVPFWGFAPLKGRTGAAGASCAAVAAALRASVRLRFTLHAGAELYGFRWRRTPARS